METIQIETRENVAVSCAEVLDMIKDSRKDNPNDNLFVDRMQTFADQFHAIACPAFERSVTDVNVAGHIDETSAILIRNTHTADYVPISCTPNNSCFFNALSTALYGREELNVVLRIKTFFYMAKHWLSMLEWYGKFTAYIDCPYEELINCGLCGGPSSVLTFVAAARALHITIESCYPIVNGITSMPFRDLNSTFTPTDDCQSLKDVHILWTGPSKIADQLWRPDHFVCMVPVEKSIVKFGSTADCGRATIFVGDTPSPDISNDSSCLVVAVSSTSSAVEPLDNSTMIESSIKSLENSKMVESSIEPLDNSTIMESSIESLYNSTIMESSIESLENSTMMVASMDPTVINCLEDLTSGVASNEPVRLTEPYIDESKGTYPLIPYLSNSDAYRFIKNCQHIHELVPIFPKKDVQFVVNFKNYFLDNTYRFHDECGAWSRASRKRNEFCYLLPHMNLINRRNDVLCRRKIVNRKVGYVPIVPQPDPKTVVKITKLYQEHGKDPAFRRTIFLLNEYDTSHALYQYKGQQPSELSTKQINPMIYHSIRKTFAANPHSMSKDAITSIKNMTGLDGRSLRNLKHYEKKKGLKRANDDTRRITEVPPKLCTTALVDKMKLNSQSQSCLLDLVGGGFVQAIKSDSSNSSALIIFTDEQISDMLKCGERFRSPLGIARAFTLGEYLITAVSYQNLKVVKRGTSEAPTIIGPIMVQPKGTAVTDYGFFIHTLKEVIINRKPNIDFSKLIFVSDCDEHLFRALKDQFPDSTKTRCLVDIRSTVEKRLGEESSLSTTDKASALEQIVCLLHAKNRSQFREIKKNLLANPCMKCARKYIEGMTTIIRQDCLQLWEKKLPAPLSIIQADVMSQVIDDGDWDGGMIDVVTHMERIVRKQCDDLYNSIWHDEGSYELKRRRNNTPRVTVEQQHI